MRFRDQWVSIVDMPDTLTKVEYIARVCTGTQTKMGQSENFIQKLLDRGHTSVFEHVVYDANTPAAKKLLNSMLNNYQHRDDMYGFYDRVHKRGIFNLRDLLSAFDITSVDVMKMYADNLKKSDKAITMEFIVPIFVSRQLMRHRTMSFTERSLRYCDATAGVGLEVVTPAQQSLNEGLRNLILRDAVERSEGAYDELCEDGAPAQEARNVLPLCTATNLYITGHEKDWDALIKLRTAPGADPAIKETMRLVSKCLEERNELGNIVQV